jgi:hypothetical protein
MNVLENLRRDEALQAGEVKLSFCMHAGVDYEMANQGSQNSILGMNCSVALYNPTSLWWGRKPLTLRRRNLRNDFIANLLGML